MTPFKAKHPCSYSGCPEITLSRFCSKHERLVRKKYEEERKTSIERGYDADWQKTREFKANQDPLCEECLKQDRVVPLDVVHHIKPIEMHLELRLVMDNLISLCNKCHEEIHKGERWGR